MAQITSELVKRRVRDMFDYELTDEAAHAIANSIGPIHSAASDLKKLRLSGIEVPFGYPVLTAEAARVKK